MRKYHCCDKISIFMINNLKLENAPFENQHTGVFQMR